MKPRTIRKSIAGIVAAARPELAFSYPRTFLVRACDPATGACDVYPPPDAPDLPPEGIAAVPQWTMGGAIYFPPAGSSCIVVFRDALETRPVIVAFAPVAPGSAAASVGNHAGRIVIDSTTGAHYYAPNESGAYSAIATYVGPTPPIPATPGTSIIITTGSAVVKVAP